MSTFWPVKTQHCGLWEDKKRAVYSDNETTNEQGYRVTHTQAQNTCRHTQTLLLPSRRSRPLHGYGIICAEARLAWMRVMDSVRLAETSQSGAIRQPTRCQQRQRYKYLTLGELCLYAASKRAQGQNNGMKEMPLPLQLAAC